MAEDDRRQKGLDKFNEVRFPCRRPQTLAHRHRRRRVGGIEHDGERAVGNPAHGGRRRALVLLQPTERATGVEPATSSLGI
jgi:hypothetical protein